MFKTFGFDRKFFSFKLMDGKIIMLLLHHYFLKQSDIE